MEGYLAEIKLWAGRFVPRNWALCDGAILEIRSNTPLFALIENKYGGDMVNTFALPDLRGQAPANLNYIICVAGIFSRPD